VDLRARIVSRYLQAGVFEAPPAMMQAVGTWVKQVYAGHVLAAIEPKIELLRDRSGYLGGQVAEMEASDLSCKQDVQRLVPGKAVRYTLYPKNQHKKVSYVGVRRPTGSQNPGSNPSSPWRDPSNPKSITWTDLPEPGYVALYEVGLAFERKHLDFYFRGPKKYTAEEAVEYVQELLSTSIKELRVALDSALNWGNTLELEDAGYIRLVELTLLKKECERHTPQAKTYRSMAVQEFPFDLSGWKYVQPGTKLEKPSLWGGDRNLMVSVDFKEHKKYDGWWRAFSQEIKINTPKQIPGTVAEFQENLRGLSGTVRHELQHVGQTILTSTPDVLVGYPSRSIQPVADPKKLHQNEHDKEHALRAVEFYTRLADEIDDFVASARRVARKPQKDPRLTDLRTLLNQWIGNPKPNFRTRQFFKQLYEHEPLKWQKAVKEFVTGVERRGLEVT